MLTFAAVACFALAQPVADAAPPSAGRADGVAEAPVQRPSASDPPPPSAPPESGESSDPLPEPPAAKEPPPPAEPPPAAPTQPVASAPAQPPPAAPTPVQPKAVQAAPAQPAASPKVSDAAWDALVGRQVVVDTPSGSLQGELLESKGDQAVIVRADGSVVTTPKATATGVRVAQPPAAATPPPASAPSNNEEDIANLEAPADEEGEEGDEDLTPAQKRRKERREKREHALLGAFTMHGATYSHWRGDGINSGHASYAMDWGLGVNFSKTFGIYAIAGGLLGAKIESGNTKANYGHVGGIFAFGGKWYYSTLGAAAAFSRLRFEDGTLQKDKGLAFPTRVMARIPLPKKLYIGIGLTYELAMVRNFGRFINAIGGQIVFGRW